MKDRKNKMSILTYFKLKKNKIPMNIFFLQAIGPQYNLTTKTIILKIIKK